MIVHGGRPSPFVRKVLTVLEEKGIAHEQKRPDADAQDP